MYLLPKISGQSSVCLHFMATLFSLHGIFCFQSLNQIPDLHSSLGHMNDHKDSVKSCCGPFPVALRIPNSSHGSRAISHSSHSSQLLMSAFRGGPPSQNLVWSPWRECLMSAWVLIFQTTSYFWFLSHFATCSCIPVSSSTRTSALGGFKQPIPGSLCTSPVLAIR